MNRPWMPWYVADFVADTQHLDAAPTGAYMLLIGHYWLHGSLPDDDIALARIARMKGGEWRKSRPVIQAFFHDGWRHKRIDTELARAADISSKRRASAEQRHSKSNAIAPANAEQVDTQLQSQRKEDAPNGASSSGKYVFESGSIRLTEKDFNQWKDAFPSLNLKAELLARTEWANSLGNKWFCPLSAALAKADREVGIRKSHKPDAVRTPSGNLWPEGIT